MTVLSAGPPPATRTDAGDDRAVARERRRRLMRLLWGASGVLSVAALVLLLLPANVREPALAAGFTALVMAGALPLVASLLQYSVLGLHRFHSGYSGLRPYYPRVAIVVPAWNEGDVIGATIQRLLAMDYPEDRLRVYVVDDASTDATPEVVRSWEARHPDRVRHLRRDKGGEGKAHTLNHGISRILAEPWAEALLVIDADVLFEDGALRRMARHLSHPDVGAVTAYIKEGSAGGNFLTKFIAYEYVTAQAASRRAQNVFGALACLAGGAQLHSRENLESIGGRIDTSSLAEDTVTTFRTQLSGKRVVFDGNAVVWAEEPGDLVGLWKQRLRWARGNVQISLQFAHMWLHGEAHRQLGGPLFAFFWFSVLLMPVFMIGATTGLVGLHLTGPERAWETFRILWILHAVVYVYTTAMSFALDPSTARRAWAQGILFPGVISLAIIVYSVLPGPFEAALVGTLRGIGVEPDARLAVAAQLFLYLWLTASMGVAYLAKWTADRWGPGPWVPILLYLSGYGAFLCAVTFAAYVREIQGAGLTWDKTVKTGRVALPR